MGFLLCHLLFLPQKQLIKCFTGHWFAQTSAAQKLTIVGEVLSQVEEGERHQDVEGPVDSGRAGVTCAPRPQRVDLWVDGPWHGTHPWEEEMRDNFVLRWLQVKTGGSVETYSMSCVSIDWDASFHQNYIEENYSHVRGIRISLQAPFTILLIRWVCQVVLCCCHR